MQRYACASSAVIGLFLAQAANAQEIAPTPTPAGTIAPSAAGSAAQDQDMGLSDIVVTAQKREQNVQDVPIAVTALGAPQLGNSGVVSTTQLNVAVPGVNIRTTSGSFQPSIRGVGTSANFVENPIALYIDGVYYPFQREGLRELNDIEQIAVLKGPQGTLFGRNATGGVIQITTRAPSHTPMAEVRTSIDNYATWKSDVYLTGGLTDTIAASLSASHASQGDGWGRNATTGNDTFEIDHNWAIRGKLLFSPTAATDITIIGDYQNRDENNGPYFRNYPGTVLRLPGVSATGNLYDSNNNIDSRMRLKTGGVSGQIVQDFGSIRATSITAVRRSRASAQWDIDGTSTRGQENYSFNRARMFSQELQIASAGGGDLNWALGAYYLDYSLSLEPFDRRFYGALAPLPTSNAITYVRDRERARSFAPFAQADFTILPDTRLTLGARWTYEKRDFVGTTTAVRNNGTINPAVHPPVDSSATVRKPSWRVSLDHQFSPAVLGYLSYNRGVKSGGYNVAVPTTPAYSPETLDAYEAGLKTELFDNRLRFNAAAFYYAYDDLQLSKFTNGAMTLTNASAAQIYGLDADFEARPTSELRLTGGLSLLHSEYRRYQGAQFFVPVPTGGVVLDPTRTDASGNRLQLAQKFSASLTVTYTRRTAIGAFTATATEAHNGDYFFEADNFARQPAYDMVNAQISWTSLSDRVTAAIFARNLLDERVIGQAGAIGTVGLIATYTYEPRVYGVSLRIRM